MSPLDELGAPVEAIVFDCGDTLLRLDPSRETIFREAAAELGLELPSESVVRAYESVDLAIACGRLPERIGGAAAQRRAVNEALCLALGIESATERLHPMLLERFATRRRWRPFDDAREALERLSRLAPLHVLANWDGALAERLAEAGLVERFVSIVASEALGVEKPAVACFAAFAAKAGIEPGRSLYVGNDYVADVVGARRAGFRAVLVDRAGRRPAADCPRVASLTDLAAALEARLEGRGS
jgi:putative hydrolase of the HAD superfamily